MGEKAKAKEAFEKIGVQYSVFPWRYEGGPEKVFVKARIRAGLAPNVAVGGISCPCGVTVPNTWNCQLNNK